MNEKYLYYLENLRGRLYHTVILFCGAFLIGFFLAGKILKKILELISIERVTVAASSPFQFANVAVDIGFFIALMVTIPYLIYNFYSFIAPALTKQERWDLFKSIPASIGLFTIGFSYGLFVLYYALQLLASINVSLGIENIWNISEFLSQMFLTAALLGAVFEFPLLFTLLIKMNLIDVPLLRRGRRVAYFLIFCLVSLLPPTDGLSLVVMSLPLALLYEVTILLNNHKQTYVWTRH